MATTSWCQTRTLLVKFSLNQPITGQTTIFIPYDPHTRSTNIAVTQLIAEKMNLCVLTPPSIGVLHYFEGMPELVVKLYWRLSMSRLQHFNLFLLGWDFLLHFYPLYPLITCIKNQRSGVGERNRARLSNISKALFVGQ